MKTKTLEYYINIQTVTVSAGKTLSLVEGYEYYLEAPAVKKDDGSVWIPVKDFGRIFAHVLDVEPKTNAVEITAEPIKVMLKQRDGRPDRSRPPRVTEVKTALFDTEQIENVEMLNLSAVMRFFDYRALASKTLYGDELITFTVDENLQRVGGDILNEYANVLRGKWCGDIKRCFWFEPGEKLVHYHIYIPTSYDPEKKMPAAFFLHGGGGNPDNIFVRTHGEAQGYAEKMGMILVGCDAFMSNSSWGYYYPPNPGDPHADPSCPENPLHRSDEEMEGFRVSEEALLQTIQHCCDKYAIDTNNLFLFGTSMGGVGTFWFSSQHPEMFNACVPMSAIVCTQYMDLNRFKGIPYLFICGTADNHGFDYFWNGVHDLEAAGVDLKHIYVGGGDHPTAWMRELDTIFAFFQEHMKK